MINVITKKTKYNNNFSYIFSIMIFSLALIEFLLILIACYAKEWRLDLEITSRFFRLNALFFPSLFLLHKFTSSYIENYLSFDNCITKARSVIQNEKIKYIKQTIKNYKKSDFIKNYLFLLNNDTNNFKQQLNKEICFLNENIENVYIEKLGFFELDLKNLDNEKYLGLLIFLDNLNFLLQNKQEQILNAKIKNLNTEMEKEIKKQIETEKLNTSYNLHGKGFVQ